jgi:antitoxin ParD1/3/4
MVDALVQSGRYQNASEVLRGGLRMVETRQLEEAAKLDALRAAARVGIAALERGDFKKLADTDALVAHLNTVADTVLSDSAGNT